jgi:hypothetical protein
MQKAAGLGIDFAGGTMDSILASLDGTTLVSGIVCSVLLVPFTIIILYVCESRNRINIVDAFKRGVGDESEKAIWQTRYE